MIRRTCVLHCVRWLVCGLTSLGAVSGSTLLAAVPTEITEVITDATTVFDTVVILAVAITLFGVAIRLVRRFAK